MLARTSGVPPRFCRDKEALEAALKGSEARKESEAQDPRRATETAVPVEEPGTEGVVSDSKSPAAPPNPEPSVTKASDADLATAQQALHRLDRGRHDGETRPV